jgi:hypothetical protein
VERECRRVRLPAADPARDRGRALLDGRPGAAFEEPFTERRLLPELEQAPEGTVTRGEFRELVARLRVQLHNAFDAAG